jgi:hypothetical protein
MFSFYNIYNNTNLNCFTPLSHNMHASIYYKIVYLRRNILRVPTNYLWLTLPFIYVKRYVLTSERNIAHPVFIVLFTHSVLTHLTPKKWPSVFYCVIHASSITISLAYTNKWPSQLVHVLCCMHYQKNSTNEPLTPSSCVQRLTSITLFHVVFCFQLFNAYIHVWNLR